MDAALLGLSGSAAKSATLHAVAVLLARPSASGTVLARGTAESRVGVASGRQEEIRDSPRIDVLPSRAVREGASGASSRRP